MKKTVFILFMILSNLVFADIQSDIKNNNIEAVKIYVEQDEKSKPKDIYIDHLNELLSDSVYYGSIGTEKFLLEKGATYDIALLREVSKNIENVKKILEKGANPNYRDGLGYTALHLATQYNKLEVVKLLLKYGGNPSIKNNEGKTAYGIATENGYTEILKVLPKIEGDYIFKSKVHNIKEWLVNHVWWLPDIYAQKMFEAIIFPPLALVLLILAYVINFGLPIVLIVLVIKKYRKYKRK